MKKKLIYILVGFFLVAALWYFLGAKVAAILGGVAALFGWRTRRMIEEIEHEVLKETTTVEQVKRNREERLKKLKE